MAKQQPGETKAPVIIALVFFVLCTLILGYTTFAYSNKADEALKEAKGAEEKQKTADKNSQLAKAESAMYRVLIGIGSAEDKRDVEGSKDQLKDSFDKATAAVTDRIRQASIQMAQQNPAASGQLQVNPTDLLRWDAAAGLPQTALLDGAVKIYAGRVLNDIQTNIERKKMADDSAKLGKAISEVDALKADLSKKLAALPGDIAKAIENEKNTMEEYKKKYEESAKEQRDKTAAFEEQKEKERQLRLRQEEIAKSLAANNERILRTNEAIVDPFQFDRPQGRIIRRYSDNLVDIDLGSGANLRRGLTFAIFPADTPTRGMQSRMRTTKDERGQSITRPVPKGKIEVIDILGPNLAQCRITEEESQVRDRILAGDLLYNAIWRKGESDHIVLYGIFDLDGDGRDDIKTLIRDLQRVGVAVDAYYDFSTMKWVGQFTGRTAYAVEGFRPSVNATDGNAAAKANILAAMDGANKEARSRGVQVLRPRDFFPRVGYNARLDVSQDAINQAAAAYIRQFAPGAEAPKDEKKDEGKEPKEK